MAKVYPLPKLFHPDFSVLGGKPVGPVEIDWTHPLSQGLVGYWLGGDLKNYADDSAGELTGSISTEADEKGLAWVNNGSGSTDRINLGSIPSSHPLSLTASTKATMFFSGSFDNRTTETFGRVIDKSSGGGGADGYTFYIRATDDPPQLRFDVDGDLDNINITGGAFTATPRHHSFAISVDLQDAVGSEEVVWYQDGALLGTDSKTVTAFSSVTTNAALLNWNHSTTREHKLPIYVIAIWSGIKFTAEQQERLNSDPYQILKPAVPLSYFIPAAGGVARPQNPFGHPFKGAFGGPI